VSAKKVRHAPTQRACGLPCPEFLVWLINP
jgi:hypothetical protein